MSLPDDGNDLRDRFRGAFLGTLAGDALGMPVEGWPAGRIRRGFGEIREMREARLGAGTYTDDTQMTAALAEALLETDDPGRPDLDLVARCFADHFEPERGYGGNSRKILAAIRDGEPWREAVEARRLPGGSYGDGAAMRAAPAALACYPEGEDAVRVADVQSRVTGHDHPEGRFGARLQAAGVLAGLLRGTESPPPRPAELVEKASVGWDGEEPAPDAFVRRMEWIEEHPGAPVDEAAARIGTGSRASRAVPAAFWAFLVHPDDPEEAVVTAVALGGDTDTIGAMTGALAGARNGASTIPIRWMESVESTGEGREALVRLADRLHHRVGGES